VFKVLANIEVWDELFVSRSASEALRAFRPADGDFQGRSGHMTVSQLATRDRGADERPHYVLLVTEGDHPALHHSLWLHLASRGRGLLARLVDGETLEEVAAIVEDLRAECAEADRRLVPPEPAPPERKRHPIVYGGLAASLGALLGIAGFTLVRPPSGDIRADGSSALQSTETALRQELRSLEARTGTRLEHELAALHSSVQTEITRLEERAASPKSTASGSLGLPLYARPGEDGTSIPFSMPLLVAAGTSALEVSVRLTGRTRGVRYALTDLVLLEEDSERRAEVESDDERWTLRIRAPEEDVPMVLDGTLEVSGCLEPVLWASLSVQARHRR
jgi:hypothetical protein